MATLSKKKHLRCKYVKLNTQYELPCKLLSVIYAACNQRMSIAHILLALLYWLTD